MKIEEKTVIVASMCLFVQFIWAFVSVIILKQYLPYDCDPYSEIGCNFNLLEHLRDMFILFIPSWIYLIWSGKYLIKG